MTGANSPAKRTPAQVAKSLQTRQDILEFILAGDGVENDAIEAKFNVKKTTLRKHLYELRDQGLIGFAANQNRMSNSDPRGKWVRLGFVPASNCVRWARERSAKDGDSGITRRSVPAVQVGARRDELVAALFGPARAA